MKVGFPLDLGYWKILVSFWIAGIYFLEWYTSTAWKTSGCPSTSNRDLETVSSTPVPTSPKQFYQSRIKDSVSTDDTQAS